VNGLTIFVAIFLAPSTQHYDARACVPEKGQGVRKLSDRPIVRLIVGRSVPSALLWLASAVALMQCGSVTAEVYRCVGADGTTSYSDSPCDSKPEGPPPQTAADSSTTLGAARRLPVVPAEFTAPVSSFDRKIHELLLLTQLSARESPGLSEVARSLVPRVDPNLRSALQDPRWGPLSNMIQADIRSDVPQLVRAFADADQSLVHALASQMQEADVDSLSSFFRSVTGVTYLQFQGEMRAVYGRAVRRILGYLTTQTPISQSSANPAVLKRRLVLVTLGVDAASLLRAQDIAHNVGDPSPYAADGILPQQIAALEGPALDALAERYEASLAAFESFNESPITKHFYSIVGRPIAAKRAEIEIAMREFENTEEEKYGTRWKAAYRRGIYYTAVIPELASAGMSASEVSGPTPQIRYARYASPRNGRSFDVTYALQSACPRATGSCRVACGNQLAGDPDFGQTKYCQISFQCSGRPMQNVRVAEGGTVTLACAP
jgi:Domain of unknown function (DUF4124)